MSKVVAWYYNEEEIIRAWAFVLSRAFVIGLFILQLILK